MRSKIPYGAEHVERPVKMHDIIAFYRDSGQLEAKLDRLAVHAGESYDFQSYQDVKPENMDNPPIQHMSRLLCNRSSKEPIVHRDFAAAMLSAVESAPAPEPAPAPAPAPAPVPAPASAPAPAPAE